MDSHIFVICVFNDFGILDVTVDTRFLIFSIVNFSYVEIIIIIVIGVLFHVLLFYSSSCLFPSIFNRSYPVSSYFSLCNDKTIINVFYLFRYIIS